ncbi:MAG: NAD+ synthase [Pseudomonadota bacterium]
MTTSFRLALAQVNLSVGDVQDNTSKIIEFAHQAKLEHDAHVIAFPELTVTGYPPEDLLLHQGMRIRVAESVERLKSEISGIGVIVGYPEYVDDTIYNSLALIADGQILANYRKRLLPNYAVFDEKRYFEQGDGVCIVKFAGVDLGLTICEDTWYPGPVEETIEQGAQIVVNINASPFSIGIQDRRERVIADRLTGGQVPMAYVNWVGGQDELLFDGGSLVMKANGEPGFRAPRFKEGIYVTQFEVQETAKPVPGEIDPIKSVEPSVYEGLVMGVRDYVNTHGFPGVVIGLSGGVDSALTLAVAVDALGAERVSAIMMPSRYTSDMSLEDAQAMADGLGVEYHVIPIEPMFNVTLEVLSEIFAGLAPDTTEENIQARCRGIILMAISNKTGKMVLTTGNKSEMAVGYATLYGDMAGGFAPIKDCSKTLVYALCHYRNTVSPIIPERIITREPTAELREDQKDSDSLPPYDVLDPILESFIEEDLSVDQIVDRGFDKEVVVRVLEMVKRNEYKRRQSPPGIRVSRRAFGRDWRYPIMSGYRWKK